VKAKEMSVHQAIVEVEPPQVTLDASEWSSRATMLVKDDEDDVLFDKEQRQWSSTKEGGKQLIAVRDFRKQKLSHHARRLPGWALGQGWR
jgi:hypothetical protein